MFGGKLKLLEVNSSSWISSKLSFSDRYNKNYFLISSPLFLFPEEVIVKIISLFSTAELGRFSRCCKDFNRLCNDKTIWKSLYAKSFGKSLKQKSENEDWKKKYQDTLTWKNGELRQVGSKMIHSNGDPTFLYPLSYGTQYR